MQERNHNYFKIIARKITYFIERLSLSPNSKAQLNKATTSLNNINRKLHFPHFLSNQIEIISFCHKNEHLFHCQPGKKKNSFSIRKLSWIQPLLSIKISIKGKKKLPHFPALSQHPTESQKKKAQTKISFDIVERKSNVFPNQHHISWSQSTN